MHEIIWNLETKGRLTGKESVTQVLEISSQVDWKELVPRLLNPIIEVWLLLSAHFAQRILAVICIISCQ